MFETTVGYLELDNGSLYYETAGVGETLVLSHAAFLDCRMFDAHWEALAQRFRVIRYDMRGYGRSSAVTGPVCRRDDLIRLLDHLNIQQAHFVGCSNGGEIALDLALEEPSRVLSLTLVGSTPGGFEPEGEMPPYMLEMFNALQAGDVEHASELQIRIWLDGAFREPSAIDPLLRQKALMMNATPVQQKTFLIGDMVPVCPLDPPAITRLHEVTCPVLLMVGALDHSEILRATDLMQAGIPDVRKIVIPETGHVPGFEKPADFANHVLDFLAFEEESL